MGNQNPIPNQTLSPENIPAQNPAVETSPSHVHTAPHIDNPPPKKPFLTGKIILIAIILLILLGLGGTYLALKSKPKPQPTVPQVVPTPSPTPIDETANWKTYTNTIVGYQIKYPNRYSEPRIGNSPPIPATGTEDETRIVFGDTQSDFYFLSVFPFSGTIQDLKKKKDYGYSPGGWENSKDVSTEEQVLHANKIEGPFVTATYKNPELRLIGYPNRSVFFLGKNRAFVLFGWSSHSKDELPQMFSTFKFIDSESSPTPTCKPRPACLDATPRCLIPETSDMCPKSVACPQDAKLCPNGKTYVGRQGPNCEFAPCPGQ